MGGRKTPPSYVLDREACLRSATEPNSLNQIIGPGYRPALYTLSCIRKVVRKLDSGSVWGLLESRVGITCYSEDAGFFEM